MFEFLDGCSWKGVRNLISNFKFSIPQLLKKIQTFHKILASDFFMQKSQIYFANCVNLYVFVYNISKN